MKMRRDNAMSRHTLNYARCCSMSKNYPVDHELWCGGGGRAGGSGGVMTWNIHQKIAHNAAVIWSCAGLSRTMLPAPQCLNPSNIFLDVQLRRVYQAYLGAVTELNQKSRRYRSTKNYEPSYGWCMYVAFPAKPPLASPVIKCNKKGGKERMKLP